MLAAHMDEVGLMVTSDEGDGIYRFESVGGVSATDLAGKVMWVGKEHIPGVIGLKPIHLLDLAESKRPFTTDSLRLDTGPAAGKVKIGDIGMQLPSGHPILKCAQSLPFVFTERTTGLNFLQFPKLIKLRDAPSFLSCIFAFRLDHHCLNCLAGEKIAERIPITLLINVLSLLLILVAGIPLGVISAVRRGSLLDRLTTIFVFTGFQRPSSGSRSYS
jgi:hypothetical protein